MTVKKAKNETLHYGGTPMPFAVTRCSRLVVCEQNHFRAATARLRRRVLEAQGSSSPSASPTYKGRSFFH